MDQINDKLNQLLENIAYIVIGKRQVFTLSLVALLAQDHIMKSLLLEKVFRQFIKLVRDILVIFLYNIYAYKRVPSRYFNHQLHKNVLITFFENLFMKIVISQMKL